MSYGIADLSIVPMRSEKSERSEMVSQILFGEVFEILEVDEKWVYVRMLHDRYEGWIDRKMYLEVTEEFIGKYKAEVSVLATEVFNINWWFRVVYFLFSMPRPRRCRSEEIPILWSVK